MEELTKNIPKEERDLTGEIIQESDRGMTLVCTEVLNLELERLLKNKFALQEATKVKKFIEPMFRVGGSLASFSSRIVFAYALGYITEPLFMELERVRSIRNKFAHSSSSLRLNSPPIASIVAQCILGREIKALFLKVELLPTFYVGATKNASPERWHFFGVFTEINFELKTLRVDTTAGEHLSREFARIKKEYFE